jgi:hypothetical protein
MVTGPKEGEEEGLYMFRALLAHPQEALGILRAHYISWLQQD